MHRKLAQVPQPASLLLQGLFAFTLSLHVPSTDPNLLATTQDSWDHLRQYSGIGPYSGASGPEHVQIEDGTSFRHELHKPLHGRVSDISTTHRRMTNVRVSVFP
jgi:hypothetical protein